MNHESPLPAAPSWTEGLARVTAPAPVPPAAPGSVGAASATAVTPPASSAAPSWFDCELFCISDYAGVGGRRCGWRGKLAETRWDPTRRVRPCPRCGEATLMELDFSRGPLSE